MKIAFYLDNSKIKDVDMSNPNNGNPGIGGTQYMIWIIAYYLNQYYSEIEVTIFANYIDRLPECLRLVQVDNIKCAVMKASKMNIDIFVFRSIEDRKLYELIEDNKLKSVAWAHNFSTRKELKYINECEYVKKYICVGKQQYNMLRDHSIIRKSDYIYNCINTNIYVNDSEKNKKNILCYVGSINKSKGFHKVAKMWSKIRKIDKNSELWVIGSGQLYNKENKMGKYGIANASYEKEFIKYISNKTGKIYDDVVFWGVLSEKKKIEIMSKAKVGIVNPTARTETFCISAIEFEALGVPIVTKRKNGFIDTVKNGKTGILKVTEAEMIKCIIRLFKDNNLNSFLGKNANEFVNENFNIEVIIKKWYMLINNIINNNYDLLNSEEEYTNKDVKKYILLNKRLKDTRILRNLPSIYEYKYYIRELIYKLKKGV